MDSARYLGDLTASGWRILIVEDDVDLCELLGRLMWRSFGQCCSLAGSLSQVEESALSYPPNLVLLDLTLQGAIDNGLQVARFLRARPQTADAFIIAMSNHTWDPRIRKLALNAGGDLWLPKSTLFANFKLCLEQQMVRLQSGMC